MGMPELEIYSMIGAEGFARLVAAFYRQVPQDDLLGPMYPASDLPGAEQRLRDFLIGRFGVPRLTSNKEAIPASGRGTRRLLSIRLSATAGCG
jgi:truncated hemoglobin YjbI